MTGRPYKCPYQFTDSNVLWDPRRLAHSGNKVTVAVVQEGQVLAVDEDVVHGVIALENTVSVHGTMVVRGYNPRAALNCKCPENGQKKHNIKVSMTPDMERLLSDDMEARLLRYRRDGEYDLTPPQVRNFIR